MNRKIERILNAYYSEYSEPLKKQMYPELQQMTYPDQEQSYTDLSMMDSPHGGMTDSERYKFVYPEQEWSNADWAGGNFLSPYENGFLDITNTPNTNDSLFDHLKGGSMINDLGNRSAKSIDTFLETKGEVRKITAMDLSEFMKVSDDTLIHKSKQDLWKMFKDKSGNIFIKRLFEEDLITD